MMRYRVGAAAIAVVAALAGGCKSDSYLYGGPDYVMFADSVYRYGVQQDEEVFKVTVAATRSAEYDRTLAVEVVEKRSNAIEGVHYRLLANTVTIPAGKRTAEIPVKGVYDRIGVEDSLGFTLNLLIPEEQQWACYGTTARVMLQKVCPFDMNHFTGYCKVRSTFFLSELGPAVDMRLIRTERVEGTEHEVVLHDLLYDGYDVVIAFDPGDPMAPRVVYDEQCCATTGEVTGGMLAGDGKVLISPPAGYVSYFSSCEHFVLQYFSLLVRNRDGSLYGSMGTYVNVLEWISDAEAEKLREQGY